MTSKNYFIFLFLFFFINASAQTEVLTTPYDSTLKQILLLKNKEILPIENLGNKQIAYLNIGEEKSEVFQTYLEKYTKINSFNIPKEGDLTEMLPLFKEILDNHNLLIIKYHVKDEIGPTVKSFINYLAKGAKIVLAVFGKPDNVSTFINEFKSDGLVLSLNAGDLQESLMAQAIFGAVDLKPQRMKIFFENSPTLLSLYLKNINRLGYTPSYVVKIDSAILSKKIGRIVKRGINEEAFPGAQILVAKNGKIVFHKTYGFHTYQNEVAVKQTDIYDLASVTKITAALPILMQLHSLDKFDLNKPWSTYYPDFNNSNKADLKFIDILSHQARLEPWLPNWTYTQRKNGNFKWFTVRKKPSEKYSIKLGDDLYLNNKYRGKILKEIKKSPLLKSYGYKYSGLAFYVFPDMLSSMLDENFESYLRNKLYKPLGATTLGFKPLENFSKENIIPTERDSVFRHQLMQGIVHDEGANMMGQVSGNAGLFSNANDLAKLLQMYLNKGQYGGVQYISPETIDTFTMCHFCEDGNRRGLGFDKPLIDYVQGESHTAREASSDSYGHSGYTGTYVWMDPKHDLLFIFMSNRVYPSRTHRKIYELDIRPKIQEAIYDAIYEWKKMEAKKKIDLNNEINEKMD